jgi:hypothetical protein
MMVTHMFFSIYIVLAHMLMEKYYPTFRRRVYHPMKERYRVRFVLPDAALHNLEIGAEFKAITIVVP